MTTAQAAAPLAAPNPIAGTAFDPATVKPERKQWTRRTSDEVALQVWRVIANRGPKGVSPADIRSHMNDMDDTLLTLYLQQLRRNGHIYLNGIKQHGAWIATATPPLTEDMPVWMNDSAQLAGEAATTAAGVSRRDAAEQICSSAKDVPASVFALADGVDIDAVHRIKPAADAANSSSSPRSVASDGGAC